MKDRKKADEIAANRVQLIMPVICAGDDAGRVRELKERICRENGISERTLRRYLEKYRNHGFDGLKPLSKGERRKSDSIPEDILNHAITLRREVPSRSVAQIIRTLEWEGHVHPGQIKRSTLQDRLSSMGYSTRHMKMYKDATSASRRFQRRHRNDLWHSDIKYGPYLPIGPGGSLKQVYLVLFLDDATRFVLHGQFYPSLEQTIVEDCFRQSIQKFGVPERVYFDNGKQYRTKWMGRACSKLGIRLMYAKPYSPEGTGKIERLNRYVDSFLSEASIEKPKTLDELNRLFSVWLSECHQSKSHSSLADGMSPETAYRSDSKAIIHADPSELADAFLHCEERKVDKSGCISFEGMKYEVGLKFIGCKVSVVYDPSDTSELTIEYEGHKPWQARKLVIGEKTGPRPALPEHIEPCAASSSRVLAGAKKQSDEKRSAQLPAVSYRYVGKAVKQNV